MSSLRDPAEAATAAARLGEAVAGETTTVAADAVGGLRLVEAVVAADPRPAHDYATMDGFAVAAGDPLPLSIRDRTLAPDDDPVDHAAGTATRIATGAPLPRGADAVVPREDARVDGERLRGPSLEAWTNVVRRGSYCSAGETLVESGTVLSPRDAAILRDLGRDRVTVREPLSAAVVATGDEVDAGAQPDRDSATIAGLCRRWGHDATLAGTAPDDSTALRRRLRAAAETHDVLVTSGGTSVGRLDHTVGVLADLGAVVWRGVALRPGRPAACIRLGGHDAVAFALPGKPVAAYVAAVTLLAPFFRGARALPWREATVDRDLALPEAPLEYAIPVAVADGTATPVGTPGTGADLYDGRYRPGRVASCPRVLRADGLAFRTAPLVAGDAVEWTPFPALETP
ncbi:molybdopterin molybdotransferase MoeA [Haloplanus halophilus]|uniref:molybdopterin molybdotransferase MoeA n=1 Tax=Haloplanus halophilus TaxID=2949993 RepID=UPI00203AEFEA|nr:molybdopterin molybdotransferase MoeA [Haloplanus sp. GDY1]